MRNTLLVCLGLGLAVGCGGSNNNAPSASDSNASSVSDTAGESAELAASFSQNRRA